MFERFTREARRTVERATEEARLQGSSTVEAEHLLLALSDDPAMQAAGLDHEGVLAALDAETTRSLAAVGVTASDFQVSGSVRPPATTPRWGTSSKVALERTLRVAVARADRRIVPGHILVAILRARAGTVPRALQAVDVDPVALATRVESSLGAPPA